MSEDELETIELDTGPLDDFSRSWTADLEMAELALMQEQSRLRREMHLLGRETENQRHRKKGRAFAILVALLALVLAVLLVICVRSFI